MPMPNYQIQNVPQMQRKPGALEIAGDVVKNKAITTGLEMAFPGSGFASEVVKEAVPMMFQQGGRAPLGGGQSKEGLMQARQLGALSQKEFLEAMKHAGYLEKGGDVKGKKSIWDRVGDAAKFAWGTGRAGEKTKQALKGARKVAGDTDLGSVAASFFAQGGYSNKPMYQRMGGMTPGPLGMSDMLAAGKDKAVSKVTYKKKGGDIEDQVEIAYHDPNKPKAPLGGSK